MEAARLTDPAFWATHEPAAPGSRLPEGAVDPVGLVWFQSSGTTGQAKWIGLTREALLLSAAVVNRHLGVTDADIWGLALPLHHVGGFGVVARAFEAGARLAVFAGKWEPVGFRDWLEKEGVNHLSLVPTQVHDLVKAKLGAPATLRTLVVGGGVLDQLTGRAARDLGWPVLASYGMTEAGSQIATQSFELLGKPYVSDPIPILPHWDARVGDEGCLHINGESLYGAALASTADGWQFMLREGEWYATRDLANLAGQDLQILGRADRQVKVLGELVNLEAIESEVEAAVVALFDDRRGARLVAVSEDDGIAERVDAYNARVEGPRRLGGGLVIGVLPRSDLGKIQYDDLRCWLEQQGVSRTGWKIS